MAEEHVQGPALEERLDLAEAQCLEMLTLPIVSMLQVKINWEAF